MCGSRFGIGYVGTNRGMTRRPLLPVDAGIGVEDHHRRVVCDHQQSSAIPVSGSTVGVLKDSLVEKARLRRQVGTSATHGADQVTGEIRAVRRRLVYRGTRLTEGVPA